MGTDEWVVLVEYQAQMLRALVDPEVMDLRYLEQELRQQGIDTGFDPYPPGEGDAVFTNSYQQPIRLMVKASDLERSKEIARDLLAASDQSAGTDS